MKSGEVGSKSEGESKTPRFSACETRRISAAA
jgi:hypothetical protein